MEDLFLLERGYMRCNFSGRDKSPGLFRVLAEPQFYYVPLYPGKEL